MENQVYIQIKTQWQNGRYFLKLENLSCYLFIWLQDESLFFQNYQKYVNQSCNSAIKLSEI